MDTFTFHGNWNCAAKCGLDIKRLENKTAIVMLTELPDNPGTSVTNAYERVATIIRQTWLPDIAPEDIVWVEHYPAQGEHAESFDLVVMEWSGGYKTPNWCRLPEKPLALREREVVKEKPATTEEGK